MKKVWKFLVNHLKEDFDSRVYGVVAIALTAGIWLNYKYDFEDSYLDYLSGIQKFMGFFLLYAGAYFFTIFIYTYFKKRKEIFTKRSFWIRSLFFLSILSIDSSVPFLQPVINKTFAPELHFYAYKILVNIISFFTIVVPALVFYFWYDRDRKHLYGLNATRFDAKPYFTMLLIMLPLLISVSFEQSFLRQYPMYKSSSAHSYLNIPEWITAGIYEVVYGLDFITVEFLFRGCFVIGMISVLGRTAVLPMAVIYCALHFGKPAGEAISSIFGGYILGVVAYETRSIWGGIIVHVGIAWSMELIAFIQKSL